MPIKMILRVSALSLGVGILCILLIQLITLIPFPTNTPQQQLADAQELPSTATSLVDEKSLTTTEGSANERWLVRVEHEGEESPRRVVGRSA